jgi:hypothetical protein
MFERQFMWCGTFAATFFALCVCLAADPSAQNKKARLEDHPDYARVEKRFDEVYHEAIAQANPDQRAVFEKEHARWLLDREKLKEDPETYIAYTEQEIRYFAGYYDEP